ncbi:MAG: hypothetical protein JWP87_734 [Labilithrix sp.]|jgi:hypothetical protein|nr:hypothetical protein [Labilithrix sp.]
MCCRQGFGGDPGDGSFECVSSGNPLQSCQGGQQIKCDDRTDCPTGQVCCGAFDSNQGYRSVQCAPSCNNSPIPGLQPVRFCDPNAPVDECAEIMKTCTASGSLPGFHVCK